MVEVEQERLYLTTELQLVAYTHGMADAKDVLDAAGLRRDFVSQLVAGNIRPSPPRLQGLLRFYYKLAYAPATQQDPGYLRWEEVRDPQHFWDAYLSSRKRVLEREIQRFEADTDPARQKKLSDVLRPPQTPIHGFFCEHVEDSDVFPCGQRNCRVHNSCPLCSQKPCVCGKPWVGDRVTPLEARQGLQHVKYVPPGKSAT